MMLSPPINPKHGFPVHFAPRPCPKNMSATTKLPDEENTRLAMRKSCDFCYFHKKRCDGDGVSRCRRCSRKGEGHPCIYSHRKRKERRRQSRDSIIPAANSSSPPDGDVNGGTQPLKRYSLSPSPATGLVGLRENTLLSDFFACVGFLPFTSHSKLLQSMMGIMIRKQDTVQAKGALLEEGSERDLIRAPKRALCARRDGQNCEYGRDDDPCRDPSTCVFWCAIAIGGIAKGQQLEEVARYTSRAKAALKGISGPATVELARAWTILAYTYGLGGDIGEFNRYLQWAHACLRDASRSVPNHDIQVGFAELVEHRESVKRSMVDIHSTEVEELCSQDLHLPQISDFATEGEMYRFFMHTYRALEQAFFMDLSCHETPENGVCTSGEKEKDHVAHSIVLNAVLTRLRVCLREFERLENAVDRPHIQKSVGGFLINCMLVFVKASKGDVEGSLQRSSLCVEFLERFPGFCSWLHTSHILASVLATMSTEQPRARQLYETLRAVYNPAKGDRFPSFPPLEEWSEHSFHCDNFYCSSMIWAVSSRKISFSSSQRCRHQSPPLPENIVETIDNHSDGFTAEIHEPHPLTSFGLDGSASRGVGIRAVSPTSSSGTDEAWADPLSKDEEDGAFTVQLGDDAMGCSEFMANVVPSEPEVMKADPFEGSTFKVTAAKVNHFAAEAVKVDVCKTEPWKVDTFKEADTLNLVDTSDAADTFTAACTFKAADTLKTEAPAAVKEDMLDENELPPHGVPYLMAEEADALGSSNWLEATFAMLEASH